MSDVTDLLKFLHGAGTSVIPWLLLAIAVWLIITLRPHVVDYISAQKKAKTAYIEKEGERNEIIRNCSATIEACTAALEMISSDRTAIIDHIDSHERMSQERMEHIQTVVNKCRDEIIKARGDLKGINSRLENL